MVPQYVWRLFAKQKLPDEIWEYIDELKLHVYEMRHLPEKTRQFFQVTLEKACEGLGTTVGRYEEAKKLL